MCCSDAKVHQISSGADAPAGNTRSHPEHDGQDAGGRWYYAGDGMEEQAGAGAFLISLLPVMSSHERKFAETDGW